jgi:hypothetical protein
LTKNTEILFRELFSHSDTSTTFLTFDELLTTTGMDGYILRGCVEDLKQMGFAVEDESGVQITGSGRYEAGTRWVD